MFFAARVCVCVCVCTWAHACVRACTCLCSSPCWWFVVVVVVFVFVAGMIHYKHMKLMHITTFHFLDVFKRCHTLAQTIWPLSGTLAYFQLLWCRANDRNVSQLNLYGVQHIQINLTLIHSTLFSIETYSVIYFLPCFESWGEMKFSVIISITKLFDLLHTFGYSQSLLVLPFFHQMKLWCLRIRQGNR